MRMSRCKPNRRGVTAPARLTAVALLAAGLAGCGGDQRSDTPPLSASHKAELAALIEEARSASKAEDRSATERALSSLEQRISSLKQAERLSSADAAALLTATDRIQARVSEELPPATETTPTEPLPTGDEEQEGEGHEEEED